MDGARRLGWLCLLSLGFAQAAIAQTRDWYPLDESPSGTPAQIVMVPGASNASTTVFDVIVHGFWGEPRVGPGGTTYTKIDVPGLQNLDLVGAPHLPVIRELLAVPTDAGAISFTGMIPLSAPHTYTIHLWPQPVSARQGETDIPEVFTMDPVVYGSPAPYPAPAGTGNPLEPQAAVPNAPVEAYPCRWTPATDQLQIYPRSRWQFDHSGAVRAFAPITRDRVRLCKAMMFNWSIIDVYFPGNVAQYQGEYVFVYPSAYLPSIKPMIAQKKARGFTVGQIMTDTLGVVTSDVVKQAIEHWYLGTPVNADHYCLIAAEATRIQPFNLGTNMDPEWSDDFFGYIKNNWYVPDIWVGRLAPVDATDMTHQVSKILNYEDHPVSSPIYYRYVLLAAHQYTEFWQFQNTILNTAYAVQPIFGPYYGSIQSHTNAGVSNLVNSGEGITCYRGHGGPSQWNQWNVSNQNYQYSNVDALSNGSLTTVVWTIACNNSDPHDQYGIGLHWMSKYPGGAVSHYGASVPSNHDPNDILETRLFEAVWDKGITCQGQAIASAETQMAANDPHDGGYNAMVYMLFGDPQMHIRREGPPNWTLDFPTHLAVVSNGQQTGLDIRVRDASGAPVDALVSLWKPGVITPADEVATNHYTGTDGWAHFLVSPQSSGFIYFSVSDTLGNAVTDSIPVAAAAGVSGGVPGARPFHAEPSVTRAGTRWVLQDPARSTTALTILAVDGRRVATISVPAGAREIIWAGTNDRGERVGSGVYLAEYRSHSKTATARVIVVH
jgi:hypothetical protein